MDREILGPCFLQGFHQAFLGKGGLSRCRLRLPWALGYYGAQALIFPDGRIDGDRLLSRRSLSRAVIAPSV